MRVLLLFLSFFSLAACQTNEVPVVDSISSRDSLFQAIVVAEKEMLDSNQVLIEELGAQTEYLMVKFCKTYPEDSLTPGMWLKAGQIAQNLPRRVTYGISYFEKVYLLYPDAPEAPLALFFRALAWDTGMKNKKQAALAMEEFLSKFPDHPLAAQGQTLMTLYRDTISDEEKVKKWMKENENKK